MVALGHYKLSHISYITAQKMKFSVKDFFSKCDQIRSFLRIWSHLPKKSLMENFIFCAVYSLEKKIIGLATPGNLGLRVFKTIFLRGSFI